MSWELIRALFPRWNFFDRVSYQLVLEVKQAGTQMWQPLPFNAERVPGGLFVNPLVTRLHAEMSLLESFTNDVQAMLDPQGKIDMKRVQSLTSFKMVRVLVANRWSALSNDPIQFRLSAQAGEESAVIFVSDMMGAK